MLHLQILQGPRVIWKKHEILGDYIYSVGEIEFESLVFFQGFIGPLCCHRIGSKPKKSARHHSQYVVSTCFFTSFSVYDIHT